MSILKCPICNQIITKQDSQYICLNNHSFDISRQGYSNFLLKQSNKIHGDSKEMLLARNYIQQQGLYTSVANKIIEVLRKINHSKLLDIGCGTGYYTSIIQKEFKTDIYGIDISKDALKIAGKANGEIIYLVASNKNLPMIENSIDIILNVFSPLYLEEATRVLKDEGYILVVCSNENHLIELKEIIYDKIVKKDEDRNVLTDQQLTLITDENVIEYMTLDNEELHNLFLMTPHYWTSSIDGKNKLKNIKSLEVQININFKLYRYLQKK